VADIANIRKLRTVIKEGKAVDPNSLPTSPIWYKPARRPATSSSQADGR
jgi:hypothetical protein